MAGSPHEWFDGVGDLGTWLGSLGTLAAFAVGFRQIHRERRHRLLREAAEHLRARRAHADHVTAWISGGELVVANGSGHPVHDVEVRPAQARTGEPGSPVSGLPGPAADPVRIPFVLPGEHRVRVPSPPHGASVPALLFTDSRGDRWHRPPGEPPVLVTPGRGDEPAPDPA